MQIILLGRGGQVATHLESYFRKYNIPYIQISRDDVDFASIEDLRHYLENIRWVAADEKVIMINAVAYTNVDRAESEIELAYRVNCEAPKLLADYCKRKAYLFVHYSTDYVFDGTKEEYNETDDACPINVYGASKLAGERAIIGSGCQYLILRTSWVYSEYGSNFVKKILELAGARDSLNIISDQFGRPTYADFIASTTIELIKSRNDWQEIINVVQPETTSWYDYAQTIIECANLDAKVKIFPITSDEYITKAKRPRYSVLSIEKLKALLPEYEIVPWLEDLKKVIEKIKK